MKVQNLININKIIALILAPVAACAVVLHLLVQLAIDVQGRDIAALANNLELFVDFRSAKYGFPHDFIMLAVVVAGALAIHTLVSKQDSSADADESEIKADHQHAI